MKLLFYVLSAALVWNLVTFLLMGYDKHQAVSGGWRISEKNLFLCSFLFGGPGIALGMSVFRHKTKHLSFRILVPLSLVVDGILAGAVLWYMRGGG